MECQYQASFLLLLPLLFLLQHGVHAAMDTCYDEEGLPSRCMPKFHNVAFNRSVMASNVCGTPPEDYCMQTGSTRACHRCQGNDHYADFLTDFHSDDDPTWWQSQSMFYGVQHPTSVNLTLHLGKAFEITYVRLKFYTSRPESFAIYKRTSESSPWQPYQYYSASCGKTYGRTATYVQPGEDERMAVCTNEFSDISPLTGGNVAFSTLEGRPSAYNFDQSTVLQDWVTATDLLISLDRLNTFGDEFFKDSKVLRSYFYAISDFSVGGRCKCNGHASECVLAEVESEERERDSGARLICSCQHYTTGVDCQECLPFYQDRPWARATVDSANECKRCNCSGRADQCVFDAEQYRSTASGGRCVGCRDNTDGPHCERCREHHHRTSSELPCTACNCNPLGSQSLQCDPEGRCLCSRGVTGEKCDVCLPGFHSLGPGGCRPCDCDLRGSIGVCSLEDGACRCRDGAEGHACDRCRPGFFNLQLNQMSGCQPCFCFGHSVACSSSNQHTEINITSSFTEDQEGWVGEFSRGMVYSLLWKEGEVYLLPLAENDLGYYKAPERFLGNQLLSYGRLLSLTFTAETPALLPSSVTVLLEGSGTTLIGHLSPDIQSPHSDSNLSPQSTFTLRLNEEERRLQPSISSSEFRNLLFNLTALKISNAGGINYTSQLQRVTLSSASLSPGPPAVPAPWVEDCYCPLGFTGQYCERCATGFTREVPGAGPFSPCVPCNCHMHGPCHPDTGVCNCGDHTTGPTCERCLDGYYGNALIGRPDECRPCPCPGRSNCVEMANTGEVVCTNCPAGQRGTRCQMCEDGFYGDPLGRSGSVLPCQRCDCSGNVDVNALGVCDHVTGRCLKCQGHTEGEHCQRCRHGYYGDAINGTVGQKCKPCSCAPAGTSGMLDHCDPETGRCHCLSHVTGRDCSFCEVGFYNLQPGLGCERCNCNPIGSSSTACHPITGQCVCRPGVEGGACSSCRMGFFGFSSRGCRACNCDPMGSASMQCHGNGTCHCRQGFVGYKCDQCEINYYLNRTTHQCDQCPECYGLVKQQAEKLKARLQEVEKLLSRYDCRGSRYGNGRQHPDHQHHAPSQHGRQHQAPPQHGGRYGYRYHDHATAAPPRQRHGSVRGGYVEELGYHGDSRYGRGATPAPIGWREQLDEDALPNAIEDFLAVQEAREAFVQDFTQLEASTHTLSSQLRLTLSNRNCSTEEEEEKEEGGEEEEWQEDKSVCRTLSDSLSVVRTAQKQLQQATLDLKNTFIPFELTPGPNRWNSAVNESRFLETSHTIMAEQIVTIATKALSLSNQTFSILEDLLDQNHTEDYIKNLADRLSEMQQVKENLTVQVNQSLANQFSLEAESAELAFALGNLTLSLQHLSQTNQSESNVTPGVNQSDTSMSLDSEYTQDLQNRVSDLSLHVQTKEELIGKIREEMNPKIQTAQLNMERTQDILELTARSQGSKAMAVSSVVMGKEAESEVISLHRQVEDMQREWPARQTATTASLRKERIIMEKMLPDINKKVLLAEKNLRPALENATTASHTAKMVEDNANRLAVEAKASLSRAKQTKSKSSQLSSIVGTMVQELSNQENHSTTLEDQLSQPPVSLASMRTSMEEAQRQLENYHLTLTELLTLSEGTMASERFERVLNETALRLSMLRGSVESPALGGKIQKLRAAARDQQARLSTLDQDLREIREERDSLRDIATNLPKSCPKK